LVNPWCLAEVLSSIQHARPDIVLLDVTALDIGVDIVNKILTDLPETRVLIRCELSETARSRWPCSAASGGTYPRPTRTQC
jgi:hypothetical protein